MEVPYTDATGNNTTINTDTFSDKDQEIAEAVIALFNLCKKYDVTAIARVISDKRTHGMATASHVSEEKSTKDYNLLLYSLDEFIKTSSKNVLGICHGE